jgi:ABC-2 type transport system ATP-binding protein
VKPEAAAAPAPPPPTVSAAVAAAQRATHAPDVVAPEAMLSRTRNPRSRRSWRPRPSPRRSRNPNPSSDPSRNPSPVEEAPTIDIQLDVDIDAAVPALRVQGLANGSDRRGPWMPSISPSRRDLLRVVGPNGAGKTTTLSMIAGLLRADEGTVEIAGIDLAADPARAKRQMGILPDRLRTFDRLTGRQLLHYYGVLRGLRHRSSSRAPPTSRVPSTSRTPSAARSRTTRPG